MDTFKLTLYRDLIAEPKVDVCLAEGKLYLVRTGLQCADRGIQHLSDFTQESIIAVRFAVDLQLTKQCFIFSRLCFCDNILDLFLETAVIAIPKCIISSRRTRLRNRSLFPVALAISLIGTSLPVNLGNISAMIVISDAIIRTTSCIYGQTA